MDSGASVLSELFPAVTQSLFVTLVGYVAGRFSILSEAHMQGIAMFASRFSLPSLIFLSLATINFETVNWSFFYAVLITKIMVFALVFFTSVLLSKSRNISVAALSCIFCTQSNDFVIGYAILSPVYAHTYPEFLSYLYLVAPISLCFLNPIAFFCIELSQQRRQRDQLSGKPAKGVGDTLHCIVLSARGVAGNPVVMMTVAGMVANLALDHNVPRMVHTIFGPFSDAFSATAMLLLGLRIAHPVRKNINRTFENPYIASVCLVFVKSLITPLLAGHIISFLVDSGSPQAAALVNFTFFFGLLPSAPGVLVYSSQYNVMTRTVSRALVMGTVLAAPLLFVAIWVVSVHSTVSPSEYATLLKIYLFSISKMGLVCGTWVIALFILNGKFCRPPHSYTFCLVLSQILLCVGGVLITSINSSSRTLFFVRFLPCLASVLSVPMWTALLAVRLIMLQRRFCSKIPYGPSICILTGCVLPIIISATILAVHNNYFVDKGNPSFVLGLYQSIPRTVVLTISLFVTAACIYIHSCSEKVPLNLTSPFPHSIFSSSRGTQTSTSDISKCCQTENCNDCNGTTSTNDTVPTVKSDTHAPIESHQSIDKCAESLTCQENSEQVQQINRHITLLLFLSVSMMVSLFLSIQNIFTNQTTSEHAVVDFIEGALNFGQIIFVFVLFGVDGKLLTTSITQLWHRLVATSTAFRLHRLSQLSVETGQICCQFCTFPTSQFCKQCTGSVITPVHSDHGTSNGQKMVTCHVKAGFAEDRDRAVDHSGPLVKGRGLQHPLHYPHFNDGPMLYSFVDTGSVPKNNVTKGHSMSTVVSIDSNI